jgi:methylaspartate mutase sigma subunit
MRGKHLMIETSQHAQQPVPAHRTPTVVLGTIGSDAHVVAIFVLRRALRQAGFEVAYLGAMVAQEEFIDAAKETAADAIWVSSLYGMGRIDCTGLRDKCVEAGLGNILLYIGGVLVTDPEQWEETRQLFLDMGFDRVYPPGTKIDVAIADLKADLESRRIQ